MAAQLNDDKPAFKLTYFDFHGRGLQIRLLFHFTNTPYQDHRVHPKKDWPEHKPNTPMGHMPVLEHGNVTLFDSTAIVSYVAKQVGMWPESDEDAARSIALINYVDDMWTLMSGFARFKNPIKLFMLARTVRNQALPNACAKLAQQLKGDYFFGDEISPADLSVFSLLSVILEQGARLGTPKIVAAEPRIQAFYERMAENSSIAKYMGNNTDKF